MIREILEHWRVNTTHKYYVFKYCLKIGLKLIYRGLIHDLSKYGWKETKHFYPNIFKLKQTEYGTEEYRELLRQVKPAITEHYSKNRHHPEYYDGTVKQMSFVDEMEFILDCIAATRKNKNGDPIKSIEHNKVRFQYDETRVELYKKILKEL